MRLALIAHVFGFNDGQARVNYEVARAAAEAGIDLTLVAESCAQDLLASGNVRFVEIAQSKMPIQLLKNLSFAIRSARWIRRNRIELDLIQGNGFIAFAPVDIVTAHFVHGAWLRSPYSKLTTSWLHPRALYQRAYSWINSVFEQTAFRRARRIIAVSTNVASELRSVGVLRDKISIIFNGVDVEEFCPRPQDRRQFGVPENVPLFLFCGDIRTRRKNLDGVLKALAMVDGVHLAVAGSFTGSPFLSLAKDLGVWDRVHFLGHVTNMGLLMASSDAFIFPSRYDPLGLVVLEAMAAGLPVITAVTTGAHAVLDDPAWTLDDPEDTGELARLMQSLANDPDLRIQVGAENREKSFAHTWKKMARTYLQVYDTVFEGKSLPMKEHGPTSAEL